VAWQAAARTQQRALPVIGWLNGSTLATYREFVAAFKRGLADGGYVESRNVKIEYRWAEDRYDRLPALAADLVRIGVDLIATSPNSQIALTAKAATQTIPIVFVIGADPIETGLVASLKRPAAGPDHWHGHLVAIADRRFLLDPTLDQTRLAPPLVIEISDPR